MEQIGQDVETIVVRVIPVVMASLVVINRTYPHVCDAVEKAVHRLVNLVLRMKEEWERLRRIGG